MTKYLSSYFIVKYFHLFIFSPYFLYLAYEIFNTSKVNVLTSPNKPNNLFIHSYILGFLGLFAGIYNYKLLLDNSSLFIGIFFIFLYFVILGIMYKLR